MAEFRNVIIIGGGPSGFTSGLYTGRASLQPLLLTGHDLGGQLSFTSDIENFPGFEEGLPGPELMSRMQKQAERFGMETRYETVEAIDFHRTPKWLRTEQNEYECHAVIVASGSSSRMLGIPSEQKFFGRGVSTCATCDGFFYREKVVAVVGGGDSAVEEGTFLTRFARKVYIIHRRDQLRASQIMQKRAVENEKVELVWDSVVEEVLGEETVSGIRLRNVKTNELSDLAIDGLFIAIGHVPNTQLFTGVLDMEDNGYLITDRRQHTNIEGVFAGGDVQDHVFRQAITAAGTGCAAAMEAEKYIASLESSK